MKIKSFIYRSVMAMIAGCLMAPLSGCPKGETAAVVTALENGMSTLVQNKTLAEQAVRDVKAQVSPSDPNYMRAMESYQDARSTYEQFLDKVEDPHHGANSRSLRDLDPGTVQVATTNFMADAVTALRPSVNTRRMPISSAIVLPDNLQPTLQRLPKKARERLIDNFDQKVRWLSWNQIN